MGAPHEESFAPEPGEFCVSCGSSSFPLTEQGVFGTPVCVRCVEVAKAEEAAEDESDG